MAFEFGKTTRSRPKFSFAEDTPCHLARREALNTHQRGGELWRGLKAPYRPPEGAAPALVCRGCSRSPVECTIFIIAARVSVLTAFISTRFKVKLSHVGACMTATLSSSHTSSLVLADARIGWPHAATTRTCSGCSTATGGWRSPSLLGCTSALPCRRRWPTLTNRCRLPTCTAPGPLHFER